MQVRANVGMMQISNSRFCTVEQIESFNMRSINLKVLLRNKIKRQCIHFVSLNNIHLSSLKLHDELFSLRISPL